MRKKPINKLQALLFVIAVLVLASCGSSGDGEFLKKSKYLKSEGAGFTLVDNSLTFEVMFSAIENLPEGTIAVITFENPQPCEKAVTIKENVAFKRFMEIERKIFEVRSPVFSAAKPNTVLTVSMWLSHNGIAIGHHTQPVKLNFTAGELEKYNIKAVQSCGA